MKCSVCGRELQAGQMFCQCGNTVNTGGQGEYSYDLDVNRPSSGKVMTIAVAAGFVLFATIVAVVIVMLLGASSSITDPMKWETVTTAQYQMTRPANMKKIDYTFEVSGGVTDLGTFRSGDVLLNIATLQFTSEQKKYLKRKKVSEQLKELIPSNANSGGEVKERGAMYYTESEIDANGTFFGSNKAEYVAAYYVTTNGLYVVQVLTPSGKYARYHDSIFSWLDSFRPN